MKILILTRSFYPIVSPRSFRATELAKELSRQGHNVKVVTFRDPKHIQFAVDHKIEFGYLKDLTWKKVNISGNSLVSKLKRATKRILQLAIEYPDIQILGRVKSYIQKEFGFYDAIISIAVPYPIHWGLAASDWKRVAKTWIADCGDPYYGDTADSFRKFFYFKYVEKWAFRKADKITIPMEEARKGYFPEFRSKIHIIPQGFDLSGVNETYIPNPIPTFVYAGSFIQGFRDPRPFLDYLVSLKQEFKFIIYTKSNLVKPYISKLKGKLEVSDYIPREELMKQLSKADFLVNFDNAESVQSPSKIIDYRIASRPILNIKSDAINPTIIEEFLRADYKHQLSVDNLDQYNIQNVAREFTKLINHV